VRTGQLGCRREEPLVALSAIFSYISSPFSVEHGPADVRVRKKRAFSHHLVALMISIWLRYVVFREKSMPEFAVSPRISLCPPELSVMISNLVPSASFRRMS